MRECLSGATTISWWAHSFAVFEARPGQPVRKLFEDATDNDTLDAAELAFEELGPGLVLEVATLTPPFSRVLRIEAARGVLAPVTCWQDGRLMGGPGRPGASFHLRAFPTAAREGRELPAGTSVEVLYPGALRRGRARMYCVRLPDGSMGHAFLVTPDEVPTCPVWP